MQPHEYRKYSELQPAQEKLAVTDAGLEAADIVTPPRISRVYRRSGEIGLKFKRLPRAYRIPRKACGVALSAKPGITGKYHSSLAVPTVVKVVIVIERPHRVKPRHTAGLALLPVYPPEVNAPLLLGSDKPTEVCVNKGLVGKIKVHGFVRVGIDPGVLRHSAVGVLVALNAVGGVKIKHRVHSPAVQPAQKILRVGKE